MILRCSKGYLGKYGGEELKYLMKNADEVLYEAKRLRRNRVCGDSDLAI
jgi:PleD family two-component response regulator